MLVRSSVALPPGPRFPQPLSTLAWLRRPLSLLHRAQARYGDVFTLQIGRDRFVTLADPVDVKQVFTGDPAIYHAGEGNVILLPFLGRESVLLLDDTRHMRARKLMLPPFHGERMRRHVELMREVAEREVATWPRGSGFAVHPHLQELTLEIIVAVVFGVTRADSRGLALRQALRALLETTSTPKQMYKLLALGPERVHERRLFAGVIDPVDKVLGEVIADRQRAGDLDERDDVLSMLMAARYEDGEPMSRQELRDQLVTLLVAGHETTATALSWALERLTRHPAALERLSEEVREDAGEEYLDCVIRETLRLRPVLPFVVRKLTAPQSIGGHEVPAGTMVAPSIILIHRRPDVYPDPNAFLPERWLGVRPGPYTYLPFGGGVRRCLGATFAETEMRAVLKTVIERTTVRAVRPQAEPTGRRIITFVPGRGGEVVLT
jgi:cytochrome P450